MKRFSPMRAWAIARKETLHIVRDPWSLGMAVAIPMLLLLLFGYALTLDVDKVPMVIWDQSDTPASRDLVSRFRGSRYFRILWQAGDYAQVVGAIDRGDAMAAVVIPRDFAQRLGSASPANAQMIIDGSDSNTATMVLGYGRAVAQAYSQQVIVERLSRKIGRTPDAPVEMRPRVWFNAEMESRNYIIPGLNAVIMMVIAALLTSLTVAREWERGTMEQLIATPIRTPELVLGKLLPYFVIGMLDMALGVVMGRFLFGVPLRGNVALLFALAAVFLAGGLALGMLISIATRSQLLASQVAILSTFLPSFLLSGFSFAIANMPKPIQGITYLIPARYFIEILRGIYLKGVGLEVVAYQAALLGVFGTIVILLANVKFRKKLV